jgi:hypothetical protein
VVQQRTVGDKKPNEFNLTFTRMCISKGYIDVLSWGKETELFELFCNAAYNGAYNAKFWKF